MGSIDGRGVARERRGAVFCSAPGVDLDWRPCTAGGRRGAASFLLRGESGRGCSSCGVRRVETVGLVRPDGLGAAVFETAIIKKPPKTRRKSERCLGEINDLRWFAC